MTKCPHCHGTGQEFAPQRVQIGSRRKMIPFGRETQDAINSRVLRVEPFLFVSDSPDGRDRWDLARWSIATRGRGSALVLPEGDDVRDYRFPAITMYGAFGAQLTAWAYGWSGESAHQLGRALIDAGLDAVHVLGAEVDRWRFTPNDGGQDQSRPAGASA